MTAQPIFTTPKKGSAKLHLVNDHSAGTNSLNSLIPAEGGFVKLDTLSDLVSNIRAALAENGGRQPTYLWKSDASQAYRRLPMHPRWQVRQATLVDGNYHIDRCAVFGNRASGCLWCLFFGLVCWIGMREFGIRDLLHYVDDAFNVTFSDKLTYYKPYDRQMPSDQACFLNLLDEIGVPHEDAKQQFGRSLDIIGLTVDLRDLSITMPSDSKSELVRAIREFVNHPPLLRRHPMRAWLQILGHANWALNVFPLLKPALNSSYNKVAGHTFMNAPVYLNKQVSSDLLWFADQVETLDGVRMFDVEEWSAHEADFEIWGDASASGLAFWSPKHQVAHIADPIVNTEGQFNIFFNEALTVLAALQWAASLSPPPKRLAIHTDSSTSFGIFNSLHALDLYNPIIFESAKTWIKHQIDLWVFFIEGKKNVVADALSHCLIGLACQIAPGLTIRNFAPLLNLTGAALK